MSGHNGNSASLPDCPACGDVVEGVVRKAEPGLPLSTAVAQPCGCKLTQQQAAVIMPQTMTAQGRRQALRLVLICDNCQARQPMSMDPPDRARLESLGQVMTGCHPAYKKPHQVPCSSCGAKGIRYEIEDDTEAEP